MRKDALWQHPLKHVHTVQGQNRLLNNEVLAGQQRICRYSLVQWTDKKLPQCSTVDTFWTRRQHLASQEGVKHVG